MTLHALKVTSSCEKNSLLEALFIAYYEARKHKRKSHGQIAFEMNYENELIRLHTEIISRTYVISPSICFINFFPVKREIFAGSFRDRIVHHLLFDYINPFCERLFISDSYSCRKGRGTSYGISRVRHFSRSITKNYKKRAYSLKMNISGYFMSIDRDIIFKKVYSLLERYQSEITFDREIILWLAKIIIFNDPTKNCIIKGDKKNWIGLPKSKSLFFSKKDCGLPIGNLTSQLFSNVYLHDFDIFIRHTLGMFWYGRYVDDMILFSQDKYILINVVKEINIYLKKNVHLHLHPRKTRIQPIEYGFSFLGKFLLPYRIYLIRRTKLNIIKKMMVWNLIYEKQGKVWSIIQECGLKSCLSSYHGLVGLPCNGYNLEQQLLIPMRNYLFENPDFLKFKERI